MKNLQKQNGAALVVGLVLLLIITLMGYTGMKGTMLQEKMAAGIHNRTLANSGANSALRAGETKLYNLVKETNGVNVVGTPNGEFKNLYSYLSRLDDETSDVNPIVEEFLEQNWNTSYGTEHDFKFTTLTHNGALKRIPKYLIYELPWNASEGGTQEFGSGIGNVGDSATTKQQSFVVVGKSQSGDGLSYSLVSSLYTVVTSSTPTN